MTRTPRTPLNSRPGSDFYEFRYGRLIPGDIDGKRNFVPRLGSVVIDFKDYQYRPK